MEKFGVSNHWICLEIFVYFLILYVAFNILLCLINKWKNMSNSCPTQKPMVFRGYRTDCPESWPEKYPNAKGRQQSPIDLRPSSIRNSRSSKVGPLIFNHQFFSFPSTLMVVNDGFGVLLGTTFNGAYATLSGGPLKGTYRFNLAQFKWGPTDGEGSEHTLDSVRYAMELQLMFIKADRAYDTLEAAACNKAVVFIGYLFRITPQDNPFLSPIVEALRCIRKPNSSRIIDPFPLCNLFHPFKTKYFFYQGSITCPPCTEGVDWIVQPEALSVSSEQMRNFRKLQAIDGPMLRNNRPVARINGRAVCYFAPSCER